MFLISLARKYILAIILLCITQFGIHAQDTYYYDVPGSEVFVVPEGVTSIQIDAWGAGGEGGFAFRQSFFGFIVYAYGEGGGGGAYSSSIINVQEGDEFEIFVGYGGGNKGNGRGKKERGDSTFVSGMVDGSIVPVVMAKGGLPGDGALTQSDPADRSYLGGGLADEGVGSVKYNGGNGETFSLSTFDGGGGGGAAGYNGNGGDAGSPNNYSNGNGNTGGGDGGSGADVNPSYGEDGSFPGGGGGGAKNRVNNTTNHGGLGGHGRVIITTLTPMKIVLKDVHAKNEGIVNHISWETAREEVGDAFEIQRSADGKHFENVSYIPAHGEDKGSKYSFMDKSPFLGISYYRLKILNVDGSTYTSNIVSARTKYGIGTFNINAYPNPIKNILNLDFSGDFTREIQVSVIDMTGKVMYNSIEQSGNIQINMANWPGGLYMVHCTNISGSKSIKISKD